MTAPLFSVSLEPTPVSSLFSSRSSVRPGICSPRRPHAKVAGHQRLGNTVRAIPEESHDLSLIWSSLIELLQQGVVVTSRNLKPIYWNLKGRELCNHLSDTTFSSTELPPVVSDVCRRLIRENRSDSSVLVMECQTAERQTIRISVRWLSSPLPRDMGASGCSVNVREFQGRIEEEQQQPYILVFLENCDDVLQEELRIEQKKYDFTEREAEIWMLLRQEYTYQEIARVLQISLNTVKTHVKNVYAKRRSFHGQEKFWCSE